MRFSKRFSTFLSWFKAKPRKSKYAKRIREIHKRFPSLSLDELQRGYPKNKWKNLSPAQKVKHNLSLEVLRLIREGESLTHASKTIGLSVTSVKQHLKGAIYLKQGKWLAKKSDSIQRAIKIYSKGKVKSIVVRNSKDASLVAEYFSVAGKFLRTGDESILKKFKKKSIVDVDGKKHKFETNPDKLRDIDEAQEDSEFFELYEDS